MIKFVRWTAALGAAAVATIALSGISRAAEPAPELIWEAKGFANPESVLPDVKAGVIYVSNVNGAPDAKDGNGFISRVSLDGKNVELNWVKGFNAPKGLAMAGGKLYAADIGELVEFDLKDGKILNHYPAKDAKFLNDVAADASGNIYVSDMATNTIWRLAGGKFEILVQDAKLEHPNGLLAEDGQLRIAAWGSMTDNSPERPAGHLLSLSLADKSITTLGKSKLAGHLDGLEPLGGGDYVVSDWYAGIVYKAKADGTAEKLLDLGQGSADLSYEPASHMLYIPLMMKNMLQAYKLQ